MKTQIALAGAVVLALAGCNQQVPDNSSNVQQGNQVVAAPTGTLQEALASGSSGQFREALRAAGLDPTLAGPGPYTILAPADAAFANLPPGTMEGLMKPEAKGDLTTLLTYHILPGTILVADLNRAIDNGQGKAVLATMAGKTVTASRDGAAIVLTDQAGNKARLTGAEKVAKNGVVHPVDAVLLPAAAS